MVRLRFPDPAAMAVTAGGIFLLTLTTVAGEAEAQVFFLQGEAGQCSNTIAGDLTVTGTITSGRTITSRLEVTGTYALPPCPEGYEEDMAAFGGLYPEVHVCVHPTSGDEMVRVGDFWIDRYEASLWSQADCSGTQYGATGDDYPAGFPDTGHVTTSVYSCSIPSMTPSRQMTWFQAEQACAAMGKRLCTNAEWQLAVAGTYDPPSGAEAGGTQQCRIASTNTGPRQTGQAGATPGSSLHCISRHGAEDMIGNLFEWVADWYEAGRSWQTGDGQSQCTSGCTGTGGWPAGYGGDATWNADGRAHTGTAWKDGVPSAGLRGGTWFDDSRAGAFAMYLSYAPSVWSASGGARCCRVR